MRLVIVSNRLPLSVTHHKGNIKLTKSHGGLVTGLSSYLESFPKVSAGNDYLWVGWSGSSGSNSGNGQVEKALLENKLRQVILSEDEIKSFYQGFCNASIWPLFHYFPAYVSYNPAEWETYVRVNEHFCNSLLEILKPDDVVWIHDYHLMLLPRMLRDRMPGLKIGFFLHIPFPVFEIFRMFPEEWRRQILNGILGADLVGFHTYDYSRYFVDAVRRILGYSHNMGVIVTDDHMVKVDAFPMGIDFQKFNEAPLRRRVQKQQEKLRQVIPNMKRILSIDRLDYTKGIIKRLEAYELFLEKFPQWREKVVLMLVVIPSRTGVGSYDEMKQDIDRLVGKINGAFGTINWTPIIYQYKSLSFTQLSALYSTSDVALVTPLRDGMNLIAKEYIASRADQTGVLILSEMAGAANELGEAVIINPHDVEEVALTIERSLNILPQEQKERNQIMQDRLRRYTVKSWANDFIKEMVEFKEKQQQEWESRLLSPSLRTEMKERFKAAKRRLLLLDYDGTLVPFNRFPTLAKPDEALLQLMGKLQQYPDTEVVVLSGRDKATLERWFQSVPIDLVSEHGIWVQEDRKGWEMIKPFQNKWKESVLPILKHYADRLPGSMVEEKEFSVAWHYRLADAELGQMRVKDLMNTLMDFTANLDLHIVQGHRVVEVRNAGADKGTAALHFVQKDDYDFILAVGDDTTDEDMFKSMPEKAYTIRVGGGQSAAKFSLNNYREVRNLLEGLCREL